jgi:hypothetical protein
MGQTEPGQGRNTEAGADPRKSKEQGRTPEEVPLAK